VAHARINVSNSSSASTTEIVSTRTALAAKKAARAVSRSAISSPLEFTQDNRRHGHGGVVDTTNAHHAHQGWESSDPDSAGSRSVRSPFRFSPCITHKAIARRPPGAMTWWSAAQLRHRG